MTTDNDVYAIIDHTVLSSALRVSSWHIHGAQTDVGNREV